ncbi:MAG TPA: cobyrinate a,c-diamide synthase, partial [Nitrospira sp.]|nr:cobyrinate a,c-diamide synthase [Nitrospira sp.]
IEALAHSCCPLPETLSQPRMMNHGRTVRIGVAQDRAFCFYYPDNLDVLEAAGAEVVKFSPLSDQVLPNVEMLYLGGGYPELHGEALARNVAMRAAIKRFSERGGVIYTECGGLMYLTEAIRDFDGRSHEMVGIFPAEAVMQRHGLTLGYRTVECSRRCILGEVGVTARGHEFHYSTLVAREPLQYTCALSDADGHAKGQDGLTKHNVLALYTHLHFSSRPQIGTALVDAARQAAVRMSMSAG